MPQGVGVLDVVDLIEHERVGVTQPDEAHQRRKNPRGGRDDPAIDADGGGQDPILGLQTELRAQLILGPFGRRGRGLRGIGCRGIILGLGDRVLDGGPLRRLVRLGVPGRRLPRLHHRLPLGGLRSGLVGGARVIG